MGCFSSKNVDNENLNECHIDKINNNNSNIRKYSFDNNLNDKINENHRISTSIDDDDDNNNSEDDDNSIDHDIYDKINNNKHEKQLETINIKHKIKYSYKNTSKIIISCVKSLCNEYINNDNIEFINIDNNYKNNSCMIPIQYISPNDNDDNNLYGITAIARYLYPNIKVWEEIDQLWCFLLTKLCPFLESQYIKHIEDANIRHWKVYIEIRERVNAVLPNLLITLKQLLNNYDIIPTNILAYYTILYLKNTCKHWDPIQPIWWDLIPIQWFNEMEKILKKTYYEPKLPKSKPFLYQPTLHISSKPNIGGKIILSFCKYYNIPLAVMKDTINIHPFQLPCLELGNYTLCGEIAVLQYMAVKINSPLLLHDRLAIDQMITWIRSKFASNFTNQTNELIQKRQKQHKKNLFDIITQQFLNNETNQFLCGDTITLADIYLYELLSDENKSHEPIKSYCEHIKSHHPFISS